MSYGLETMGGLVGGMVEGGGGLVKGAVIGGYTGAAGGAVIGGAWGAVVGAPTGPGEVLAIPSGAAAGAVIGGTGGAIGGGAYGAWQGAKSGVQDGQDAMKRFEHWVSQMTGADNKADEHSDQPTGQCAGQCSQGSDAKPKPGDAFPDRKLPRDKDGDPIPDPEAEGAPHTQLGTRNGRNGKYPQAREFDTNGDPVRDRDFTDHGRPDEHTDPHYHDYVPNPTGGTPQHGPATPFE